MTISPERIREENLLDRVEREMKSRGWTTGDRHRTYYDYASVCGEIDLIMFKGRYTAIVEAKLTNNPSNRRHAYKQMTRAKNFMFKNDRVFFLYAHEQGKKYQVHWLPQRDHHA